MILAIDTATRSASLAVFDGATVRAEFTWDTTDHHTVELIPRMVELLTQIDLPIDQLTGIGVSIGPGSFTGVRVGVAAAKGIAIARDLPIVGMRSTDVLAFAQHDLKPPLVIVVRAGRGRLIGQRYLKSRGEWYGDGSFFLTTAELIGSAWDKSTALAGEMLGDERATIERRLGDRVRLVSPAACVRRAGYLAEYAWQRIQAGAVDDAAQLQPIYLAPDQAVSA